jgi:DNA invertase Pin-like site-specific DNA recombinase
MTAAQAVSWAVTLAFSYIRFSSPDQLKGDSLRRQVQASEEWCRRHGVRLDTTRTLHDLGKSAFKGAHRKNPDRNALAAFLRLVEDGKVPRGSFLIVESLDRLTREHIRPALTLLLNLIEAGIRIVQLKPVEVIYDEDVEPMTLMMALMELSRGNSESRMKSERNGAAWVKKRQQAREKGGPLTNRLPAWVEMRDGKLYVVPEKALAVRRVYQLAGQGFGAERIVRQLLAEKVPPIVAGVSTRPRVGGQVVWLRSYVSLLLLDRRAVGEFQPLSRGKPDGDPIPGYYPAVVTEDEWQRARAGVQARRVRGKRGQGAYEKGDGFANPFAGLLRDARDGGSPYNVPTNSPSSRGGKHRILRNLSAQGRAPSRSFPFDTFERALLSALREVDPAEFLDDAEPPDERLAIDAELQKVAAQINAIKDNILAGGEDPNLADVLRQLGAKQRELTEQEQAARRRAALPLGDAWKQTHDLIDAMEGAEDVNDFRLRLRGVLRREVDSIWLLIVPRGHDRLCAVQVWFAGGERHRDYLILHRPPRSNGKARKEGGWWCRSLAEVAKPGDLDLRKPDHARKLEAALANMDLGKTSRVMPRCGRRLPSLRVGLPPGNNAQLGRPE